MRLTWLGHASFRLECGSDVYFDPYRVEAAGDADIILVSHGHYDHCDPASVEALTKDETVIVCPHSCVKKLSGNVHGMGVGDTITVGAVRVEAVAAYNTNKPNHPEGSGLGYIVGAEGKRVYHAGDTDLIAEMKELGAIDAAMVPVGGKFTMDWREAADAVRVIGPRIAVPMHYGEVVGTLEDAVRFRNKVNAETKTKASVLKKNETLDV